MTDAARTFAMSDQIAFAEASGDGNPMHVDELAARRTQAGAPVVHGIHSTLWILEMLPQFGIDLSQLSSLKVKFERLLFLDHQATATISVAGSRVKVDVSADGLSVLKLNANFEAQADLSDNLGLRDLSSVHVPPRALDLSIDEMSTQQGWMLPPDGAQARIAAMFPQTCVALGADRVTAISMLSTIVGMSCPGLHSIFSSMTIKLGPLPTERDGVGYKCVSADNRFRIINLRTIARGLAAEISAFARHEPVRIPDLPDVAKRVKPGEFAGRRALIIGGSRGLGAATAKIFAAGGGTSVITYANGRAEADALAAEIRAMRGPESCAVQVYDARRAPAEQLSAMGAPITDLYYFATPKIMRQVSAVYDRSQFEEFLTFYVDGFYNLCMYLLESTAAQDLSIVYPSSIAVVDRPKDMTDYAMAKAAGEVLCADLARSNPRLRLAIPRIPRVLTDQTATVPPVEAADAITVMLRIMRGEPIE